MSGSLQATCRWLEGTAPTDALGRSLRGVHPAVLQVLARRGHTDEASARAFLARSPGDDDPFRLEGMAAAVSRLRDAVRDREQIVVYGDFDADGVTATAVLVETLAALGADVRPFIPHRELDGYGLNQDSLGLLADEGANLVVTVDCGIRANDEIDFAVRRGLDVIVTDHHTVPDALPAAVAVVNPLQSACDYGFTSLSGVGLAFKLAQALLRVEALTSGGEPPLSEERLLDLVAIGTVADVVPLLGENRSLVYRGVERMHTSDRLGLRALLAAADQDMHDLSSRDLAYVVGPRINAAGRMDHAAAALELLLASDPREAARLAATLETLNKERRDATEVAQTAAEQALAGRTDGALLVFCASDMSLGVIGLVAGRLARQYYRPAAVVRIEGEFARGSARSIPEFNVVAALEGAGEWLVRFGGHARAAGFTVERRHLDRLIEHLTDAAEAALREVDLRPALDIDAVIPATAVGWDLYEALSDLEPFGEGNPRPLLLIRDATITGPRRVGRDHLRFSLETAGAAGSVDAIAFGAADRLADLGPRADVVCSLRVNKWRGRRNLELYVEDMAAPK